MWKIKWEYIGRQDMGKITTFNIMTLSAEERKFIKVCITYAIVSIFLTHDIVFSYACKIFSIT